MAQRREHRALGQAYPSVAREALNHIPPEISAMIPADLARRHLCIPLELREEGLSVAMANPADLEAIQEIEFATGYQVVGMLAERHVVERHVHRIYGRDLAEYAGLEVTVKESRSAGGGRILDAPVAEMQSMIITEGIRSGASDLHLEPQEEHLLVRVRVDGALTELSKVPKYMEASLISRLKLFAHIDISEKRLPQDGRSTVVVDGRAVDLRVSTMPTRGGEKVVLRILDKGTGLLTLDDLGLPDQSRRRVDSFLSRAYGIILVVGPTGSGKTTTLYGMLQALNGGETNILTIEDPIEYELNHINQVQVNEKIGLTFPRILRTLLRQDPDVIMVGEIRDEETADIAIRAAITGHLVLSTLHTHDTASAITRLRDLGVASFLIASSVIGILSQRLIRLVCSNCRVAHQPPVTMLRTLFREVPAGLEFCRGLGCVECNDTGFRGRRGIFEIMAVDERIQRYIAGGENEQVIRAAAVDRGMDLLVVQGVRLVSEGLATVEDVFHATYFREESQSACPRCHEPVEVDFAFCPSCQAPLERTNCKTCGRPLRPQWNICPYCSSRIAPVGR